MRTLSPHHITRTIGGIMLYVLSVALFVTLAGGFVMLAFAVHDVARDAYRRSQK